jgi:hypothetical protein
MAAVKLATVQQSKLPSQHKVSKIDMVFVKPGLTESLHVLQTEVFSVTWYCISAICSVDYS